MKQRSSIKLVTRLLIGSVFAVSVAMVSPALAQTTSKGPYYVPPSWDQKLPAATRFIVLTDWTDEAVLDRETGLVWEKATNDAIPWNNAREACMGKRTGGRMGWRLPSVPELASLVNPTPPPPPLPRFALPAGHPFHLAPILKYWSATTDAVNPAQAWGVDFILGSVQVANKTEGQGVWCVRGGMNADQ